MSDKLATALEKVDQALAAKPRTDGDALSEAAQALAIRREALAAEGGDRARLEKLNAVISVVLAAHYPMGGTPWAELEKARGWLSELIAQE